MGSHMRLEYPGGWQNLSTRKIGAFKRHVLQKHFCFFYLLVLYSLGDNRRVRFHDNKSRTECWLNCSIVMVICLIIERLERIWWHWKRYVERLYFRKFGNTVRPVTWERFFFAQWRRVVKPITYSNSAKLAGSSSTKHHSEKRFFRKSSNFLRHFWAWKFAGFATKTGWKLPT